ncbi:MAG: hypothetical protein HXY41_11535 [Chloroflexi bacterium]|nr:hypothetical protein [Chloroflexota bacterium]
MLRRLLIVVAAGFSLCVGVSSLRPSVVFASGNWNGQDTYHVPISWCAAQGSPAVNNPNVAGDTTTNNILWRRHERPTDNIYVNPTGITFRSAINSFAQQGFSFPTFADMTPTPGTGRMGDLRDITDNPTEFNTMLNLCGQAWNNLGRAGVGIMAINVNLFHNAAGDYLNIPGYGGCVETAAGVCALPINGRVALADNHYLYPGVPNPNWPPTPGDPGGSRRFTSSGQPITDPWDIAAGHAFGRALGLPQSTSITALMLSWLRDNNGDGQADNRALTATEVIALRSAAAHVPHVEADPQGEFNPGAFVAHEQYDGVAELDGQPPHLDLSHVTAGLELETNRVFFDQHLLGLLPEEEQMEFWFLLDTDGVDSGADAGLLAESGVPETNFQGVELVARVVVQDGVVTLAEVSRYAEGGLFPVDGHSAELLTLVMHPIVLPEGEGDAEAAPIPVSHSVRLELPDDLHDIEAGQEFRLHTIVTSLTREFADHLDDAEGRHGRGFTLEPPVFPHCAAQADGLPGGSVPVALDGLTPDAPIHGLLGPDLVFTGQSDEAGGGLINLPIPQETEPGYHLVTVGVDDTALTADCVVYVQEQTGDIRTPPVEVTVPVEQTPEVTPPVVVSTPESGATLALLTGYEDLLRWQERNLHHLGILLEILARRREVRPALLAELIAGYEMLLYQQAERLADFEALIENYLND